MTTGTSTCSDVEAPATESQDSGGPGMVDSYEGPARVPALGRQAWAVANGVSAVAGLLAAAIVFGGANLPFYVVSMCVAGLLILLLLRSAGLQTPGVWWTLAAGLVATSWLGLVALFGPAGVVWVLALVVTSAPARAAWRKRRRLRGSGGHAGARSGDPRGATVTPFSGTRGSGLETLPPEVDVPALGVDALCLAWRRSYLLLGGGLSTAALRVVQYRQCILDEIDRRDSRGLSRWLASGPRAAGNPLPYLVSADDHVDEGPRGQTGDEAA